MKRNNFVLPLLLIFCISIRAKSTKVFDYQPQQVHIAFGGLLAKKNGFYKKNRF